MSDYTKDQEGEIAIAVKGLHDTILHNNCHVLIATPALMILSATYAATFSSCTDEEIVEEYKKCLLDARTRVAQAEGNGH